MSVGIYSIQSPSGAIYIGQSRNVEKRWKSHKRTTPSRHTIVHKSFKKYGFDNHKFRIEQHFSDNVPQLLLDRYEMDYINHFRTNGFDVMNITDGGGAPMLNRKHSTCTIEKMRKNNSGERNPNYGKGCFGAINGRARKVIQLDLLKNVIREFDTITEAAAQLSINRLGISNVVTGRSKTAGGFIFKYKL